MKTLNSYHLNYKEALRELLLFFGENTERDGLQETPDRVLRMYGELLSGYSQNPAGVFKTFKSAGYKDLVTVTNIKFYSLCEHHIIPFYGSINIGYIPNGKVLGLSKFVRLVELFSHRLQTQENLTNQIANSIETYLKPKGLIINVEATHLCMSMRGVRSDSCVTKTTTIRGSLKNDVATIDQFYRDIKEREPK